jgi:alpha-L-fucosidase
LEWFKNAGFGLFIHWGLYSLTAGYWKGKQSVNSAHIQCRSGIPLKEYAALAADFNPQKFSPAFYADLALSAGMKYLVFTAKHHDGFAMYRSRGDRRVSPPARSVMVRHTRADNPGSCPAIRNRYTETQA